MTKKYFVRLQCCFFLKLYHILSCSKYSSIIVLCLGEIPQKVFYIFFWTAFRQGIIFLGVTLYSRPSLAFMFDKMFFMKQFKSISAATFLTACIATNSCSQLATQTSTSVYEATTPCNEAVKILLAIPATTILHFTSIQKLLFRSRIGLFIFTV